MVHSAGNSIATVRHGDWSGKLRADILNCEHKAKRLSWEWRQAFHLKACLEWHTSSSTAVTPKFPNSTNWGPSVQIPKTMGTLLIQILQPFQIFHCFGFLLFFLNNTVGEPSQWLWTVVYRNQHLFSMLWNLYLFSSTLINCEQTDWFSFNLNCG